MERTKGLIAIALSLCSGASFGAVVTFDEIPSPPGGFATNITSSGGLHFDLGCVYQGSPCVQSGVEVMDISALYGSIDLASSGSMGALVGNGLLMTAANGQPFDFSSAYFGMTHPFDNYSVQIKGFVSGIEAYSTAIFPGQSPTFVSLGWVGVDSVQFFAAYNTGYLTMDDLSYSQAAAPVPLPAAVWLLLSGIGGLGLLGRRRNTSSHSAVVGHGCGMTATHTGPCSGQTGSGSPS